MTNFLSPLWRFIVTDLAGNTITVLDHVTSERRVTPKLNEPLELSGTVPSDSQIVNVLHTDNLPYLAEGVRQIYGFRRESDSLPYYTIRAATLVLQIDDSAQSGDARSRFTAWDPWQYLFSRPVLCSPSVASCGSPGALLGPDGLVYDTTWTADAIILDMLNTAIAYADPTAPYASQAMFLNILDGVMETCPTFAAPGWKIQQGTSIGQAFLDLAATGNCDIVLSPLYDPTLWPGYLCTLNIYSPTTASRNSKAAVGGAGEYEFSAIFAWDQPGRSMVGVENFYDGTGRANTVQYYYGQGGPPATRQTDAASIARYGEYWTQQFFPAQPSAKPAVTALAAEQLVLRKNYKQTLTVNPAPERSPEPFVDYQIGDAVPVFVGTVQQGAYALGDNSMRQSLPPGYTGAVPSPDPLILYWQRVYGIPVEIDDNGVETVRELIVGPIGSPPPIAPASGVPTFFGVSISSSLSPTRRRGTTTRP